jgi:hypothetical protein
MLRSRTLITGGPNVRALGIGRPNGAAFSHCATKRVSILHGKRLLMPHPMRKCWHKTRAHSAATARTAMLANNLLIVGTTDERFDSFCVERNLLILILILILIPVAAQGPRAVKDRATAITGWYQGTGGFRPTPALCAVNDISIVKRHSSRGRSGVAKDDRSLPIEGIVDGCACHRCRVVSVDGKCVAG